MCPVPETQPETFWLLTQTQLESKKNIKIQTNLNQPELTQNFGKTQPITSSSGDHLIHCTVSSQFANAEKALVKIHNSLWADTMFFSLWIFDELWMQILAGTFVLFSTKSDQFLLCLQTSYHKCNLCPKYKLMVLFSNW